MRHLIVCQSSMLTLHLTALWIVSEAIMDQEGGFSALRHATAHLGRPWRVVPSIWFMGQSSACAASQFSRSSTQNQQLAQPSNTGHRTLSCFQQYGSQSPVWSTPV